MNLLTVVTALFAGVLGYFLALAKDRSNTIHAKKMEAMTKLHARVLDIEKTELSDAKSRTLKVLIIPEKKPRDELYTDEEFTYLQKQAQWRQDLHEEGRGARLWLSRKTVNLSSSYLTLMMTCKTWGEFRQEGSLIEDEYFLDCLRRIFGNAEVILEDEKIVMWNSYTQKPWLLNCDYLSDMCLEVIQKRLYLEISPFPYLKAYCQKWLPFRF